MKLLLGLLIPAAVSALNILSQNFPNLIIPVDSSRPTTAIGTQYSGHIALWHDANHALQTIATEIVFDNVPNVGADYCTIEFELGPLGPFALAPAGSIASFFVVNLIGAFVTESDTWNNRPSEAEQSLGQIWVENGVAYGGALVPCGQVKVQVLLTADLESDGFDFTWFELNDSANGVVNGVVLRQWASV